MNTQRATNKNVPTANFFETDFNRYKSSSKSNTISIIRTLEMVEKYQSHFQQR